jgi:hypothetical protein
MPVDHPAFTKNSALVWAPGLGGIVAHTRLKHAKSANLAELPLVLQTLGFGSAVALLRLRARGRDFSKGDDKQDPGRYLRMLRFQMPVRTVYTARISRTTFHPRRFWGGAG